jgi:hypothetical protein
VEEYVLRAAIECDEAKATIVEIPFDWSTLHGVSFPTSAIACQTRELLSVDSDCKHPLITDLLVE